MKQLRHTFFIFINSHVQYAPECPPLQDFMLVVDLDSLVVVRRWELDAPSDVQVRPQVLVCVCLCS